MASSVVVKTPRKDSRSSIEAAGVEFIDENGGGPGVRLKKAKREARKK